jgi:DNA-binding MarR family transcriptional regulator
MILLDAQRASMRINQQDLAVKLNIDKSNVTRLCQKTTESEHIVQERSCSDARILELCLISRGLKLAQQLEEASRERFAKLLESIPEDQRDNVMRSLKVLCESMYNL